MTPAKRREIRAKAEQRRKAVDKKKTFRCQREDQRCSEKARPGQKVLRRGMEQPTWQP